MDHPAHQNEPPRPEAPADLGAQPGAVPTPEPTSRPTPTGVGAIAVARLLLIARDRQLLRVVEAGVAGMGVVCERVGTVSRGRQLALAGEYDVIVLGPECGEAGCALVAELDQSRRPVQTIQCCPAGDAEAGIRAIRCGATDVLSMPMTPEQVRERLPRALERARALRDDLRKLERLQRMCKRLNQARQDAAERVDVLRDDLSHAYREIADQMTATTIAHEFASLIRRELDVESLLRLSLEFVLGKTGPTNAAVFLPTGRGDYALGAYVNYDIPKDAAEVLLDHLADSLPQAFEDETEVIRIGSHRELARRIGEDASWLSGNELLVMAGHHKDECVAVITLFRDKDRPFQPELMARLATLRDVFAAQLGRIITIHNRHKPKADWSGFEIERGENDHGPDDFTGDNPWGMAA
jgi:DNA-binding response OmpR family regulator